MDNQLPLWDIASTMGHGQEEYLVDFQDPGSQLDPFLGLDLAPQALYLPTGPEASFQDLGPINPDSSIPANNQQGAATDFLTSGIFAAAQGNFTPGALHDDNGFGGASEFVGNAITSAVSVGPTGHAQNPLDHSCHPASGTVGPAGSSLVSAGHSGSSTPAVSAAPIQDPWGRKKRTKGWARPDQPDRLIPPPCEEPTSVLVKWKASAKEIGGINPDWTVAQLKQHFALRTDLGAPPPENQTLRLEDSVAAPGFESARPLKDVDVLKEVGIVQDGPVCVVWLDRTMGSGVVLPPTPTLTPAPAPTGAPTAFELPMMQHQLLPSSDGNQNFIRKRQHQQHQRQVELRRQQQLKRQILKSRQRLQNQDQLQVLPHQLVFSEQPIEQPVLPNGFMMMPGQLRGGGPGAGAVESVGVEPPNPATTATPTFPRVPHWLSPLGETPVVNGQEGRLQAFQDGVNVDEREKWKQMKEKERQLEEREQRLKEGEQQLQEREQQLKQLQQQEMQQLVVQQQLQEQLKQQQIYQQQLVLQQQLQELEQLKQRQIYQQQLSMASAAGIHTEAWRG
ncbi:hypothetical protein QBC32DRAFT_316858 [Pseudoneurospora amorphoporcata]|uniref:Uncharacterized protein n=1 Tax=Pseudoneurospora amorphoporcata TaxID=241081 RepID=A0AAN6NSG1_9PEZI|nr:hypothetical protein QBC32DRAFT_316858 [Pseudoneurospora amorphoporcata]